MKLTFHNVADGSTSVLDIVNSKKWIIELAELNQYGVVKLKAVQMDSLERIARVATRHVGYSYLNNLIRKRFGRSLPECKFYNKVTLVRRKFTE